MVAVSNEGNSEYLEDGSNCLLIQQGEIEKAVDAINRICRDEKLRERLYSGGLKTARSRSWEKLEKKIINLYTS